MKRQGRRVRAAMILAVVSAFLLAVEPASASSTPVSAQPVSSPLPPTEVAAEVDVVMGHELPSAIATDLPAALRRLATTPATTTNHAEILKRLSRTCAGFRNLGRDFSRVSRDLSVHAIFPNIHTEDWASSPCAAAVHEALHTAPTTPSPTTRAPLLGLFTANFGTCIRLLRDVTTSPVPSGAISRLGEADRQSLVECLDRTATALTLTGNAELARRVQSVIAKSR